MIRGTLNTSSRMRALLPRVNSLEEDHGIYSVRFGDDLVQQMADVF
jgi:hypothetical protein